MYYSRCNSKLSARTNLSWGVANKNIPLDSNVINVFHEMVRDGRLAVIMRGLIYFQHVIILHNID